MSNFKGYYFRIGDCYFNNPFPIRDGYEVDPHLVQTTESGRVANGKMIIKELPHRPTKITVDFPIMTEEQYRTYRAKLKSMSLQVEYYNEDDDKYETGEFYHTDIKYKPIKYQGKEMIKMQQFSLIEK